MSIKNTGKFKKNTGGVLDYVNNEKGNSMMELIMVMLLLAFFGVTMCTLIVTGSETQAKIINQKDNQIDGRIALSYINVRVRQNDRAGAINIKPHPITGKNAIFIKGFDEEYNQDLWIFEEDGYLREIMVTGGEEYPQTAPSDRIIEIKDLKLETDENVVIIEVEYDYGSTVEKLTSTLYLRSQ